MAENYREPGAAWSIYEATAQQYRVIGVTSQSFLLTVGSLSFGNAQLPKWAFLIIAALGLAHILAIWCQPVWARTRIVDYYKFQMPLTVEAQRAFQGEFAEKDYARDPAVRGKANLRLGQAGTPWLRATRFRLDVVMPLLYATVWLLLVNARFGWLGENYLYAR